MITSRVLDICTFPVLGLWRIRTCMFPKYSINSVSVSVFCKKKILYHIWSARLSILLIIKSLFNLLALWYVTRLSILCLLVLSPHSPSISPWLSQDLWDSCPYCWKNILNTEETLTDHSSTTGGRRRTAVTARRWGSWSVWSSGGRPGSRLRKSASKCGGTTPGSQS